MTQQEKWAEVLAALDRTCEALKADGWPKRRKPRRTAHMIGYSSARGRRAIVEDT